MKALRRILAIALKEMRVLLGVPRSRFMILMPPVIQLFVFAWAATMEVRNVDVLVLNADRGYWSAEVLSRLRGSTTFRNIVEVESQAALTEAVNHQEVLLAMVFQNDFSRRVEQGEPAEVQLLLDGRRSNAAQIVTQYLEGMLADLGDATPRGQVLRSRIELMPVNWFNPNMDFQWFIIPNLIGMINFIMGVLITGLSVARERELGTFDQMLVSPAEPVEIAVGKLIPGCLIGLFHGTLFLLTARLFFDIPFVGSLGILYAAMLLFSLSVNSMGLMVSSCAATQQQAFLGAFTVAVPCILLSGFLMPINNMPIFLQQLSELNPLRHFIVIIQGVFLKDISLPAAMDSGARMAAIALASVVLAIWLFKRRA